MNDLNIIEQSLKDAEELFQRALKREAEPSLLTYLKKNLDYLREERMKLLMQK